MRRFRTTMSILCSAAMLAACGDQSASGPGGPARGSVEPPGGVDTSGIPATGKRIIKGKVVAVKAGDTTRVIGPVANAAVMVIGSSPHNDTLLAQYTGAILARATTNSTGEFSFTGMPTSLVMLAVLPPSTSGYGGTTTPLSGGSHDTTVTLRVFASGGPDTSHTDSLPPPAVKRTVTGTVLGLQARDSTQVSGPVANATLAATVTTVSFDSTSGRRDSTLVVKTLGTTTSDAAGRFTFADMPTSGFMLTVKPPNDSPYATGTAWVPSTRNAQTSVTVYLYRR